MKRQIGYFLCVLLFSCAKSSDLSEVDPSIIESLPESYSRLYFENEVSLERAIRSDDFNCVNSNNKSALGKGFVSLLSNIPNKNSSDGKSVTYYDAFGYDSLVPNLKFAALLSPLGELVVGDEVIRITPKGTYRFALVHEKEFLDFFEENSDFEGEHIANEMYRINENIILYKTFLIDSSSIAIYEDDNDYLIEEEFNQKSSQVGGIPEPDYNTFNSYSADRKTKAGKLIQKLIGTTQERTVKFNRKRRLEASFYNYNYGVYAEIGVNAHTDKKNWIGWSKTASDELRVGWRQVTLKCKVPDRYLEAMKDLNNLVYLPPQYMSVNGQRINVATLLMPDFSATLKDKIVANGIKAAFDFLEEKLYEKTELEKAEAVIIAARTELYFFLPSSSIVKFNTESYTHVFSSDWMDFEIGWNNKTGVFFNNLNQKNYKNVDPYLSCIWSALNEDKYSLMKGEVYGCARFGNVWRGIKIVKN